MSLVFFALIEFNSLKEMDSLLAEGRLMSSLAQRLLSAEDKRIVSLLKGEIDSLHVQAENVGMSLKFFYDSVLEEVEGRYMEAPEREVAVEQAEDSLSKF